MIRRGHLWSNYSSSPFCVILPILSWISVYKFSVLPAVRTKYILTQICQKCSIPPESGCWNCCRRGWLGWHEEPIPPSNHWPVVSGISIISDNVGRRYNQHVRSLLKHTQIRSRIWSNHPEFTQLFQGLGSKRWDPSRAHKRDYAPMGCAISWRSPEFFLTTLWYGLAWLGE